MMPSRSIRRRVSALALMLAVAPVPGLISPASAAPAFKAAVDANSDGALDLDEFVMAMGDREYQRRDADRNNELSTAEWLNPGGEFQQLTLDRFNTDGDDVMSAAELVEVFTWIFGNRDKNGDGLLSLSEAPPFLTEG